MRSKEASRASAASSSTDEDYVVLDARAVSSDDDEDCDDALFVLTGAAAATGSAKGSGTKNGKRLRRKRAQQKAAAAGAVEEGDADVSPDDVSPTVDTDDSEGTELMDANDSEGGDDVEGAAHQLALAQPALAQPALAQTDAAEAAVHQAEAEGLRLQPSDNATGFRGVYSDACSRHKVKPFKASYKKAGKNVHIGSFATAEEAALAYARTPEVQAAEARAPVVVQATTARGRPKPVPLTTEVADDGKLPAKKRRHAHSPGTSPCTSTSPSSACERALGAHAQMQAPARAQEQAEVEVAEPAPLTAEAEEALAQAAAEGLTLQRKAGYTGYKGVKLRRDSRSRKYEARVCRAGKQVHLGSFDTAEEAALAYARTPEAQAEVVKPVKINASRVPISKPAPLTADEVVAQATAEGLGLEPSSTSNNSGFKGVTINNGARQQQGRRFEARAQRAGKKMFLGAYATAEEAALAYARATKV